VTCTPGCPPVSSSNLGSLFLEAAAVVLKTQEGVMGCASTSVAASGVVEDAASAGAAPHFMAKVHPLQRLDTLDNDMHLTPGTPSSGIKITIQGTIQFENLI